jgi:hypothetical protein
MEIKTQNSNILSHMQIIIPLSISPAWKSALMQVAAAKTFIALRALT